MKIRDRYTGREIEGDFEPIEDCVLYGTCPVCGAEEDEPCSVPDPDNEGFGMELSSFVHVDRGGVGE